MSGRHPSSRRAFGGGRLAGSPALHRSVGLGEGGRDAVEPRNVARRSSRAGFSLVEIALAILVLAVGMLSVFALFPSGMTAAKGVIDDARIVAFKNEVFGTIRDFSQDPRVPWNSINDRTLYGDTAPAPAIWETIATDSGISADNIVDVGPGVHYRIYKGKDGRMTYGLRYQIEFRESAKYAALSVASRRGREVILWVWPGLFGPTTTNAAQVFFTHVYDYGM
jgi:hypothetical protein